MSPIEPSRFPPSSSSRTLQGSHISNSDVGLWCSSVGSPAERRPGFNTEKTGKRQGFSRKGKNSECFERCTIERPHEAPRFLFRENPCLFPVFSVLRHLLALVLAPPSQHRSIATVQPNDVCMPHMTRGSLSARSMPVRADFRLPGAATDARARPGYDLAGDDTIRTDHDARRPTRQTP